MLLIKNRWIGSVLFILGLPLLLSFLQYRFSIFLYRDALTFHYPAKKIMIEQLRDGEIPYWNSAASFGEPLLANPNVEPFYPDNIVYLILPFDAAWNFHFWFHWIFGIAGIYAFVRKAAKCSKRTALVAAVWWGGSGYVLSAFSFYNLLAVTAWIPWVALTFYHTITSKTFFSSVSLAVALGLQFLAGEPVTCFGTWVLLFFLAVYFWKQRCTANPLRILLSTLVAGIVILPQMIALLEVYSLTSRAMVPHSFITASNASLEPFRFFEWAIPYCWGPPFTKAPELFAGLKFTNFPFLIHSIHVSFLLLLAFLFSFKKPRPVLIVGIILFLVLASGRYLPAWKWLYDSIPFWSNIHFPVKFFAPLLFLLILCGVSGLEDWAKADNRSFGRAILIGFMLAWLAIACTYVLWMWPVRPFYILQLALAACSIVALCFVIARYPSFLLAFVLIDCAVGARYLSVAVNTDEIHSPSFTQASGARTYFSPEIFPTRHRFPSINELYAAETSAAMPLWGGPFGIRYAFDPSVDGMYSYYNDYFGAFLDSLPFEQRIAIFKTLGVGQILTTRRMEPEGWVRTEYPGFYFYKSDVNPGEFFPVSHIESKATIKRTLTGLASGQGPFSRWETRQTKYDMPEEFGIQSNQGSRFVFHLSNRKPAFIVGRITYFPVWRAVALLADGRSVNLSVNQVDLNFVGFEVPPDAREVAFFYSSRANRSLIVIWLALTIPLFALFFSYCFQMVFGGIGWRGLENQ